MEKAEIKALIKKLDDHSVNLSPYQAEFVKGIKRYFNKYNKLSDRQIETLISISKGVLVEK